MTLTKEFYRFIKKRKKKMARFRFLTELGRRILPDYRFSWPYLDWWSDPHFNSYLERFGERQHFNTDRRFMLYQLMRLIDDVPGDTVECGTFEGAGSYLMLLMNNASRKHERWHHVFDSFEGLSPPESLDGEHWSKGDLSASLESVERNLSVSNRFSLYKGWIPARFSEVEDKRFAFVHIDVDLHQPTLDSIQFFYPKMSDGGIILCDDYGSSLCPGATRAMDEYLADKPEKMIYMSCGSGFMIKNQATAAQLN
jgi:hypothetical protein